MFLTLAKLVSSNVDGLGSIHSSPPDDELTAPEITTSVLQLVNFQHQNNIQLRIQITEFQSQMFLSARTGMSPSKYAEQKD